MEEKRKGTDYAILKIPYRICPETLKSLALSKGVTCNTFLSMSDLANLRVKHSRPRC